MGWTVFDNFSKLQQIVDYLLKPKQYTSGVIHQILAHELIAEGDDYVLWTVNELTHPDGTVERAIWCDLVQCFGGAWGYKALSEGEHPYYYSCPLNYLSMVPVCCQGWRDGVLQYHEQNKAA